MSEEREFAFLWEIENINFCTQRKDDCIYSPDFKSENLYGRSWSLSLYPRGDEDSEDGYMACYLHRIDNGPTEIDCHCEYEILVISSEGTILKSVKKSSIFQNYDNCGFTNFWKKSLPFNDIKDVLRLYCHVKSITQNIPLRLTSILKTKIDVDKHSFKWIVRNLNSNCSEVKKFPCNATSEIEIAIQVPLDEVKISISKVGRTESVSVMFRISLLDVNGRKCDSKVALHFFDSTQNDVWEFPNFLKKSKLNAEKEKYLRNDCFTLKCELEISDGVQTDSVEDKEISLPGTGTKVVLEDYRRLYKDKIHADVNLFVEGDIIQAHKSILSVRSPVFMAMFNTDMVETETGLVNILDLEAETVNFLLEYIYTGTLNKLDCEIAAKLIVAADKYQVLSLKEECADLLKCFLSHENVCNVLVVADSIQHEVLKSAAMIYIKNNSERIFLCKQWKSLVEKYIPLAAETVQKVSMLIAADRKKTEDE